jgi:hypothetical protein
MAVASAGEKATAKRGRWRLPAVVTTALAVVSLSAAVAAPFATAASAAPDAPPAHGVTPGAYRAGGMNHVVYTGTDGAVWTKRVGGGPATSLGGHLISGPSPIDAAGTRIVFGEGTNHALWEKVGGGPWTSLGGRLTSKPGAAEVSGTTYSVYVRGADGAVWARNHTGALWGPWHSIGGHVLAGTGPSAAARGGARYVLVVGTNHELFIQHVGVSGFDPAGGLTTASPALVNIGSSLIGYARGTTNAGYYHRFVSPNTGWHSLGGFFTSGMGGTASFTVPYGYGLGGNSQVYQNVGLAVGVWGQVTP